MAPALPPHPKRQHRPPVTIWPTPVYHVTGHYSPHFVVTVRSRRFGIVRTIFERQFAAVEEARRWAQSARARGQQVIEEGVL